MKKTVVLPLMGMVMISLAACKLAPDPGAVPPPDTGVTPPPDEKVIPDNADEILAAGIRVKGDPSTYCNPVNISYQYQRDLLSRESADPAVIVYKNEYYLFASHGSGYWWSSDLVNWNFVYSQMPEIDKFAPAVCVIGNELYLTHSQQGAVYKSSSPKADVWEYVGKPVGWEDPALFVDDDGRVYAYYGLSATEPIVGVELDPHNNLARLKGPVALFNQHKAAHGFEVPGENNDKPGNECWLEGAWMTKHGGKYYLQYAVPGTEYAAYANGVYVSSNPLGPFTFEPYSPVSFKAAGFVRGAGHGSTVQDLNGNWWKFDTAAISVAHMFERRLIMAPAAFENGRLVTNMAFSDYPLYTPHSGKASFDNPGPDWNLLSYGKALSASSSLAGFPAENAFNENLRTWWSAGTGTAGEWITADLGKACAVNAVQINFADQNITAANGRNNDFRYRYVIEFSLDGETWYTAVDRSDAVGEPFKAQDTSHDYFEFDQSGGQITARYVRLTNKGNVPAGGKFAVSGLRLFGTDGSGKPGSVSGFSASRPASDERTVNVTWNAVSGAEGYMVYFGAKDSNMRLHYQVTGSTGCRINALNMGVDYEFAIAAYGPGGTGSRSGVINAAATRPAPDTPVPPVIPEAQKPEAAEGFTVYEAENGTLGGGAAIAADSGASGGATIRDMHLAGAFFEIKNVNGGPGGSAALRIIYSNGNPSAKTEIFLNGESAGTFTLPTTGGWNVFMRVDLPLSGFISGAANTIRFVGGQEGYNPDFVQVIY